MPTIAQRIEARAYERGRQEGMQEIQEIVAKRMLAAGYDVGAIIRVTDITFEKLIALKKSAR